MWSWISRWFFRTYLSALVAQAGAPLTLLALYGYGSELERFLSENRMIVSIVLVVHFLCYLISAIAALDRERLDAFRRDHLDDDDDSN